MADNSDVREKTSFSSRKPYHRVGRRERTNMIRSLWALLNGAERREAAYVLVLMIFVSLFEMLGVGVVLPLAVVLVEPRRAAHISALQWLAHLTGFGMGSHFVVLLAGLLLLVITLKGVVVAYGYRRQYRLAYDLQKNLADRLLTGYLVAPYRYHLTHNSADLLRNVRVEIPILTDGVLLPGLQILSESVVSIGLLGLLLLVNPALTLIVGVSLSMAFFGLFRVTRSRNERLGRARQSALTDMFRHAANALSAIKDITVLGRQETLLREHREANERYSDASVAHMVTVHVPRLVIEFLVFTGLVAILMYAEFVWHDAKAAVPLMAMYAMAALRVMPSFTRILGSAMSIRYNRRTAEILADALRDIAEPELDTTRGKTISFERELCFQNVTYSYPGSAAHVLRDVNITIAKGSTVGFVGPSGAGKSTIADAVLGLLSGYQGEILVDGVALGPGTLGAWRRRIGYVPQHIYLSDDTIMANVAFGVAQADVDRHAVMRALIIAQLQTLIGELPDGVDTAIGERGVRLSGGQRQRLGIARALYHNPDILVLDEATASLDGLTEVEITRALDRLAGTKTLIIIAHRLSTLEKCSHVYLIEDGRISDSGPLSALRERNGFFVLPDDVVVDMAQA